MAAMTRSMNVVEQERKKNKNILNVKDLENNINLKLILKIIKNAYAQMTWK